MVKNNIKEAVGVFDSFEKMQEAIDELEMSHFERRHISILGTEESIKNALKKVKRNIRELEDESNVEKTHNISPEEISVA